MGKKIEYSIEDSNQMLSLIVVYKSKILCDSWINGGFVNAVHYSRSPAGLMAGHLKNGFSMFLLNIWKVKLDSP